MLQLLRAECGVWSVECWVVSGEWCVACSIASDENVCEWKGEKVKLVTTRLVALFNKSMQMAQRKVHLARQKLQVANLFRQRLKRRHTRNNGSFSPNHPSVHAAASCCKGEFFLHLAHLMKSGRNKVK